MGNFIDLVEHFKKVRKTYVLNKTKYFEMPSKGVDEQLIQLLNEKKTMGMVSYCKVTAHKEDPTVELVNDFVFIEDVYTADNEWVEKDLMGQFRTQYRPWSNPPPTEETEEIVNENE